ncbi:MAG: hypothetical protein U9O24_09120 [Campylobacterota bacterium]|nr:hypothetical protein [Campylobacterota bacterium]
MYSVKVFHFLISNWHNIFHEPGIKPTKVKLFIKNIIGTYRELLGEIPSRLPISSSYSTPLSLYWQTL